MNIRSQASAGLGEAKRDFPISLSPSVTAPGSLPPADGLNRPASAASNDAASAMVRRQEGLAASPAQPLSSEGSSLSMTSSNEVINDFISYIEINFTDHSHRAIAIRVLECVDYIDRNRDEIAAHAGKVALLRHPGNHMAFHLQGMNAPEDVLDQFGKLVAEVQGCLQGLLQIEDAPIRNEVISLFLNQINDSDVGCMEVRLRNALTFYGIYSSSGLVHITDLMQAFYAEGGEITAKRLLEFFADKVNHQLLIRNREDELESLTWDLLEQYLNDVFMIDVHQLWQEFAVENAPVKVDSARRKGIWHKYHFTSKGSAELYLNYIKRILPKTYQADLAKASIKPDMNGQFYFELSSSQYFACRLKLKSFDINSSGVEDGDRFAHQLADHYSITPAFVKSVRWDSRCFNEKFLKGITKTPVSQVKEKPRPVAHKKITVTGKGKIVRRSKKDSPYTGLSAEEIKIKKSEYSAFQSTSFVVPEAQIPVFGHNRNRSGKLAGYIFDPDDAMLNRIFLYDGGTVNRPYEHDTEIQAKLYLKKITDPKNKILHDSLADLAKTMVRNADKYNEVLARLRWNLKSSAIGIFSDSFEANCVAQLYADQLTVRLKAQYQELGMEWDDAYTVPIIYYIPGNDKSWTPYTKQQQRADIKVANDIFADYQKLKQALEDGNPEFLLLVDSVDEIPLLTVNENNIDMPLLHYFLYRGDFQMLTGLYHKAKLKHADLTLKDYVRAKGLQLVPCPGSVLRMAAEQGHHELVELLLENQTVDINECEAKSENTALLLAASRGNLASVRSLLADKRINIKAVDRMGNNALMLAAQNGHCDVVNELLNDKRINLLDQNHRVVRNGLRENKGFNVIEQALKSGYQDIFQLLLAEFKVRTPRPPKRYYEWLLSHAIDAGDLGIVKALIPMLGVNCVLGNKKWTPLMRACNAGEADVVAWLLKQDEIDINYSGKCDVSALMLAARSGSLEIVQMLLNDPFIILTLCDAVNQTPLMYINNHCPDILAAFLSHEDIDEIINEYSGRGCSYLTMLAETPGDVDMELVKCLLQHPGINPNSYGKFGGTALIILADNASPEAFEFAKLLLDHPEIDIDRKENTSFGKTAIEIAARVNNFKMMDLITKAKLQKYEANLNVRVEAYNPNTAFLRNFSFFTGLSKTQKLNAVSDLYDAMGKERKITDPESLKALDEIGSTLKNIVDGFSPMTKHKLGI